MRIGYIAILAIVTAAQSGCGGDSGGEAGCPEGQLGCPCVDGAVCLAGLDCQAGTCQADEATGSVTSASTDPNTSSASTDDASSEAASGPGSSGMTDDGPEILSFGTNVSQITEGESVIFSVVVTDPDGIDDLIGGNLTSSDGMVTYGAFATSGQEGAYELTLSWGEIHQAQPIEFVTDVVAIFRAEFFDQSGNTASREAELTLHCDGIGACDGACIDLTTSDAHCASCGNACQVSGDAGHCVASECSPTFHDCFAEEDGFVACNDYCVSVGETCVAAGCNGSTYWLFNPDECPGQASAGYDDPCDAPIGFTDRLARCCCTQ